MAEPYDFYVESMVASRTGEPAVSVTVNGADFTTNMSPDDARALADNLLHAAASAENDAYFFAFLTAEVQAEREHAASLLMRFRAWKEKRDSRG